MYNFIFDEPYACGIDVSPSLVCKCRTSPINTRPNRRADRFTEEWQSRVRRVARREAMPPALKRKFDAQESKSQRTRMLAKQTSSFADIPDIPEVPVGGAVKLYFNESPPQTRKAWGTAKVAPR